MAAKLKREFLELLKRDEEFRYVVLGYLGISEVLKRLDCIAEEQVRLRQDFARLQEEQVKLKGEQIKLREDFVELRKDFSRLLEEQVRLREDFNRMLSRVVRIERRLDRVERTLEKLTLDVEDEAREVVEARLRKAGIEVKLGRLELPGLELDLYGVAGDVCVLGEAAVRVGVSKIEELLRKVERLEAEHPELLKPRRILVVYASLATEEAVKRAEEGGVWLLKATKDYTRLKVLTRA